MYGTKAPWRVRITYIVMIFLSVANRYWAMAVFTASSTNSDERRRVEPAQTVQIHDVTYAYGGATTTTSRIIKGKARAPGFQHYYRCCCCYCWHHDSYVMTFACGACRPFGEGFYARGICTADRNPANVRASSCVCTRTFRGVRRYSESIQNTRTRFSTETRVQGTRIGVQGKFAWRTIKLKNCGGPYV